MPYYPGSPWSSRQNLKTSQPSLTDREGRWRALDAREAFIVAYPRLRKLAAEARQPAVLVVAVSASGHPLGSALIPPGCCLILGRHTRCGLLLPTETLSLRHLAAYALPTGPSSAPIIHLWDLNTDQPFRTEDGQPSAAVNSQGMLYAAVGEYALLFVPTRGASEPPWPTRAEEAWRALPPRQFIDRTASHTEPPSYSGRSRALRQRMDTGVTRDDPPQMLDFHEPTGPAWGELTLMLGRARKELPLSLRTLERGVLLGRYERCTISLLALTSISRVHLMLIRVGQDILAIDTASTWGTRRGSHTVDAVVLGHSDTLLLAGKLQVHWRLLPAGSTSQRG
ncbi:FHA domain-containing protein [Hyalangium versicolor]|uniref:FHA domain-containing protein n=1 Tax=Hyalangium versicolor TaxID=2861190 RepID=UPI001CCA9777|nr:FHA domain-containing protein [Hyalangium versicolor]